MSEVVRCQGLTKKYGGLIALNSVDLSIESGKIIGLLGPNGSGKTTLIKIINGLLTPTSGTVTVDGDLPGIATKAKISYLPDNNYLNSWMTVGQIVDMFRDFYDDFRPQLAYEMLAKLGITPEVRLKTLSKGNKEKVSLILVMSRNARLYVLDPATRDYIISTIINNYNPEASVLISTHLISDIEQVLDEVIFINNGRIMLKRSVDDIRAENGKSVDELFREVFKW